MNDASKFLAATVHCLCAGFQIADSTGLDQKIRQIGQVGSSVVIAVGYTWWTVCDNGGELNVERINDMGSLRSVPYCSFGEQLDAATVAYRVRCVLADEAIDYSVRQDAETLDILMSMSA